MAGFLKIVINSTFHKAWNSEAKCRYTYMHEYLYHGMYLNHINFHFKTRLESALKRRTVQPFAESDDTRCCNNTI